MERIPAAFAMDWSIDVDRGLRSRHHVTPLMPRARASASSALVLPSRRPSPPRSASCPARRASSRRPCSSASPPSSGPPAAPSGSASSGPSSPPGDAARSNRGERRRARPAAQEGQGGLRHGERAGQGARAAHVRLPCRHCQGQLARRSLVLSSLGATSALEVKAALFAAGCICRLSEDFSFIILEVLRRLICPGRTEPQVIVAAIKAFSKLDCMLAVIHRVHEVGKQMVLGTLEDVFKAEMFSSLSKLASKSIILFSDQVELLLLFLGHASSSSMNSMALKCLCFMFHRNTCHFPVTRTVFGRLLLLINDEDFPLHCKSNVLRIPQKMFHSKAPSIHYDNGSELSKLVLAAENSLHSSSWEMQGTALEIPVEILCFLKQARPDLTITTLKEKNLGTTKGNSINLCKMLDRDGILVEPGFQLSLTLCMQWKRVLERASVRLVKLYCILTASSTSRLDAAGTRSKQFEPHKITEMVELSTKLLHYIKNDLRKGRGENNCLSDMDMVMAFARFEPTNSGQGFSSCLMDVSSFPEGSYQIRWYMCCVDENGSYFSLLPLNDGAVFSVRKS